MTTAEAVKLRCDCCGKEVLAVQTGNRIVIRKREHGKVHTLALVLDSQPAGMVRMT